MKSKFTVVLYVGLLCMFVSNDCKAQIAAAGSATFQEGTWVANDAMPPVFTCTGEGHDCICSLVAYCASCGTNGKPHTFTASVSAQHVIGNTLRITFASVPGSTGRGGIPASIKHMAWTQDKEVKLDATAAAELGYTTIVILGGTYEIKNNTLVVNIRKGKALPQNKSTNSR